MSEMSRLFNTTLFLDRQICTERVNAKFKMPFQRYIYFLPSGKLVLGTSDRVGRLKFHQRWMEFLPPFYFPPSPSLSQKCRIHDIRLSERVKEARLEEANGIVRSGFIEWKLLKLRV